MYVLNKMNAIQILFIIKISVCVTECRVFCQDTHASPWVPLGYSCPVMCENIINAIEKLKSTDYRIMIESDRLKKEMMSSSYISSVINSLSSESVEADRSKGNDFKPNYYFEEHGDHTSMLRDQRHIQKNHKIKNTKWRPDNPSIEQYQNIYDNEIETASTKKERELYDENYQPLYNIDHERNDTGNFESDFDSWKKNKMTDKTAGSVDQLETELRSVLGNTTCDWSVGGSYILLRKIMRRCLVGRRNGYGDDFLRTMAKTMNKYSEASFEFTEDMVQIIMERVFGTGVRSGDLIDLSKLLNYMRSAVQKHRMHKKKETTIVLKPRHCLSLSIPGCFCRPGFVEKSGQCVQPADCNIEPSNAEYLARIIVH